MFPVLCSAQIARIASHRVIRPITRGEVLIDSESRSAAILKDKKAEATTVREVRAWIEREIHLDLTNEPFDPQDERLLPKAGACARCPKRTGSKTGRSAQPSKLSSSM